MKYSPASPELLDHFETLLEHEARAEEERYRLLQGSLTAQERAALGLAIADLEAVDQRFGLGGRWLVTCARSDGKELPIRLEPGALVDVRRRSAEVHEAVTAVISRRQRDRVELAFDQPPPPFVVNGRVWLELLPSRVTYQRCRAALQAVRAMEHGVARHRRDVLWGLAPPRFVATPAPWTASQPLNTQQRRAVDRALAARDVALIHGPPGTGKSTVLAEIVVQAQRAGMRVLCTAASNAAVDHLLERCLDQGIAALRVGHPARVAERLQQHTLDERVEQHPDRMLARELFDEAHDKAHYAHQQRRQGRSAARFTHARAAKGDAAALRAEARALEARAVSSVLQGASVICATCSVVAGSALSEVAFDMAIVDEATQATEPLTLAAFPKAPRMILAGDPCQLPPTVMAPAAAGLQRSLFERLLETHGDADGIKVLLQEQYRMHADIMTFASTTMYHGALQAHPSVAARTLAPLLSDVIDAPPLLWLDTAGKGFTEERSSSNPLAAASLANPGEIDLIVARVRALLAAGLAPQAMAVIAPYSAQVALLRAALDGVAPAVEVDTVDGFQGREKDAILLSMTRGNDTGELGFLQDLRRMNVALTRARRHVFIVGDSGTVGHHPYYAELLRYIDGLGGMRSAWDWPEGGE